MRYPIAFAAAFFLAVLQASAMPYVKVLGVTPDLVLIFAACWAMVRGQGEAMVVVPLAGLLRDLSSSDPLGTSVLALAPIVLLAAARELRPMDTEFVPTLVVVGAGTLAYGVLSMSVLAEPDAGPGPLRTAFASAPVTTVATSRPTTLPPRTNSTQRDSAGV